MITLLLVRRVQCRSGQSPTERRQLLLEQLDLEHDWVSTRPTCGNIHGNIHERTCQICGLVEKTQEPELFRTYFSDDEVVSLNEAVHLGCE